MKKFSQEFLLKLQQIYGTREQVKIWLEESDFLYGLPPVDFSEKDIIIKMRLVGHLFL